MSETYDEDEWEYDAFRLGRATRTVEVAGPDGGTQTIEAGEIQFDPINEEDGWLWEEDDWIGHFVAPDGGIGLESGVAVPFELVGIVEFPEPITHAEASEWVDENPEVWRRHLEESIESDITAADILDEVR